MAYRKKSKAYYQRLAYEYNLSKIEYIAYSNAPKIKNKPCLADYGLTEEKINECKILKREYSHRTEVFYHFLAGFSIITVVLVYIFGCNDLKDFNFWELFVLLIFFAPMCFMVLLFLSFLLKFPPENQQIKDIEELIKKYQQDLNIYDYQQKLKARKYWNRMSGREFEIAVAQFFKDQGFRVELTQASNDGGVDLILFSDNEKFFVQCKHYAGRVGVAPARELYGVMVDKGVNCGYLVGLNGFTNGVYEFISNKNIKLLTVDDMIKNF